MGDVWYQDNLEYLSDLLTPYPLPPPFYCIFGVYIFFTFWKSVGRGLHGLKEATPLGGVQLFTGGGGGGEEGQSLIPYTHITAVFLRECVSCVFDDLYFVIYKFL